MFNLELCIKMIIFNAIKLYIYINSIGKGQMKSVESLVGSIPPY